jgi:excisionase family DNA binding protein
MTGAFIPAAVLAERMGVSPDTVTRWCRQGRIPAVKPGRDWRVSATVAEDLIAARRGAAPGEVETPGLQGPWREALEAQIAQLAPGDHVLVVVPGGWDHARRFRDGLASLDAMTSADAVVAHEPPRVPRGNVFSRAVLTAAARAQASGEVDHMEDTGGERRLIRWTSQIPSESLPTESRVARIAQERGWIVFCVLPLSGTPDLATLVHTHTHVLVGQADGPSWLGSARGSSWLRMTGT